MRYPVLTYSECVKLATQMAGGSTPAIDPRASWVGWADEVDLGPIQTVAEEITLQSREWTDKDRDRLEGKVCGRLYEALSKIPTEVLDDRGFWRFLSLRYFWEFIAWREEEPFVKGNFVKYVDAVSNAEAVLPRMYLRAVAVGGPEGSDLAAAIPKSVDFWRSHVIRVRTGSAPVLARAFARRQAEDRLSTPVLRETAKRLNRTWTNVVLHLYEDQPAADLIDTVWSDGENS
jgi:hypothetical protein